MNGKFTLKAHSLYFMFFIVKINNEYLSTGAKMLSFNAWHHGYEYCMRILLKVTYT